MKSKTIILNSPEQTKGRGILTIYSEDNLIKCRIRLYNVEKLTPHCKLGIYHNNQVYSANIIEKNGTYETSLVGDFDIYSDFYTAIINTTQNNKVILAGGTYAGHFFNDYSNIDFNTTENVEFLNEENVEKEINNQIFNEVEIPKTKSNLIKDIASPKELEECNSLCTNCANCIYKKYFYENKNVENLNNTSNLNDEENVKNYKANELKNVEKNLDEESENVENFAYDDYVKNVELAEDKNENVENLNIKQVEKQENKNANLEKEELKKNIINQFDYVFKNYPEDKTLASLIENSKFAKIEENNNNYSIGAIYKDNEIMYMCYAVKSNYNSTPPDELGNNYQWLPLDKEDPLSDGYYLVFQDATDFKILEL